MKKTIGTLLMCGLIFLPALVHGSSQIDRLAAVKNSSYHPPKISPITLKNGMTCYIMEDKTLPIVQAKVLIKGGTVYETKDNIGSGSVMAELLKEGGTKNKSPSEVDSILEQNAVDIYFGANTESFEGGFSTTAKDLDLALNMFFEMLFEPAFDQERMEIIKGRFIESIRRQNDTSGPIAHREFRKLVYGAESPWADTPEINNIKKIDQEMVRHFFERFIYPDRMILAVSGDFDKNELIKKLEDITSKYTESDKPLPDVPAVKEEFKAEEKFISKNFTQSAISAGHMASTRDNPDKFSLILLNGIIGGSGSFTNRLMDTIRVQKGLAYEVWSSYTFGPKQADGLFEIHAKTKRSSVNQVVGLIKGVLTEIKEGDIKEAEFKKVKEAVLNKHIFSFESPFGFVSGLASFKFFGYPDGYFEIYRKGIEKVSLDDVKRAAGKYLHPEELAVVIVGKK